MRIYPNDGFIELNYPHHSINLSCSIRELPTHTIDPLKLKWYHNNNEINQPKTSHIINKYPHHNQATLILSIRHLSINDSGLFRCIYNHGLVSKDVHIYYTSSGKLNSFNWIFYIDYISFFFLLSSAWIFKIDE